MIGAVIRERYRLDAEIGKGGIGTVYRGHDALLDRDVAVKVLSDATLGDEGRARLLREAQAVAKLHHPNIVAIYDAGEDVPESGGVPFIVMELVEGVTLHEYGQRDIPQIVAIARQVCAALDHAHSHGIIHRDLKPENVMVSGDLHAKLMDFGLARSLVSRVTSEGTVVGTVFYLAPEQALGQAIDHRVDLYALGVMLYELTAGRLPFTGADPMAIISQHVNAPVVPPAAYNPAIPAALDALIVRLMSKRPDDRPASAAEVDQALAHLDAAPAVAEELPLLERIGRGRLVARERELSEMEAVWRRALAGEGHVLLVSGEPGIGKTRLLRELMVRAQVKGAMAFFGACYADGGAAYAPISQIIRQGYERAPAEMGALPAPVLADLLTIVPDLRVRFTSIPANPVLDAQAEQQRIFESVVSWCAALSARAPLMLVLDDAHWADSGTLLLLRHLAYRTRQMPVLLVAAYREVELDQARPWHQVLLDLNRERLSSRVKVGRLDREQTCDMLSAIFNEDTTDELLDGIYRETEGNPFFIEEVCKALIEEGKLYYKDGSWHRPSMDEIQVPQSVRVAIQMRISRLAPPAQDTLRLAAILGRDFDFETLKHASDLDEEALITALEEGESAQLVVEQQTAGVGQVSLSFSHALIASTLRDGVSGLRRQRLHRRAAAAIEAVHPDDCDALAHHFQAAGDAERARGYYVKAGDWSLSVYAYGEAEHSYQTALELGGTAAQRAHTYDGLGQALALQGRFEDGLSAWTDAIALFRSLEDYDSVARVYSLSARTAWDASQLPRGLALAREGLAAVAGQATTEGVAALLHEAARLCYFSAQLDEARTLCQQALEAAERLHSPEVEAQALSTMGLVLQSERRYDEAIRLHRRAVQVAEAAGLLLTVCRAYNNLAVALGEGPAALQESLDCQAYAAEVAHRARAPSQEAFQLGNVAGSAYALGDLARIDQVLPRLRELVASMIDPGQAAFMLANAEACAHTLRGEVDADIKIIRDGLAEARRRGQTYDEVGAAFALAECLVLWKGELEEPEALVIKYLPIIDQFQSSVSSCSLLVIAHALRGECAEARKWLDEATERAADRPLAGERAYLLCARANLAVCEKDWPTAFDTFESLAGFLSGLGMRFRHAQTLQMWAEAYLTRGEPGDRQQVRHLLQQALTIYEQIGSTGYIGQVQKQLAALV